MSLTPYSSQPSSRSRSTILHRPTSTPRRSWRRSLKYLYYRLIRMQSTPEAIARGCAVGVFAGWFPLFGLQTIIGVSLAILLRGNKFVAAAATWVSNPFTYLPIYAFNLKMGGWILGNQGVTGVAGIQSWDEFWTLGSELAIALFVGSFAVGLVSAVLSYWIALHGVRYLRQTRLRTSNRHQPSPHRQSNNA